MRAKGAKRKTGSNIFLKMQLQLCYHALINSIVKGSVGWYCMQNEQCQGSENLKVCEHDRCVFKAFFLNLECHDGKLEMIFKKYILTCVKVGHLNSVYHSILICIDRHKLDNIIT